MEHSTANRRQKIKDTALSELLTNATMVDDAIRFVSSQKSKEKLKLLGNSNEEGKEESKEPDYDEYKDQLEGEQEEETVC